MWELYIVPACRGSHGPSLTCIYVQGPLFSSNLTCLFLLSRPSDSLTAIGYEPTCSNLTTSISLNQLLQVHSQLVCIALTAATSTSSLYYSGILHRSSINSINYVFYALT